MSTQTGLVIGAIIFGGLLFILYDAVAPVFGWPVFE